MSRVRSMMMDDKSSQNRQHENPSQQLGKTSFFSVSVESCSHYSYRSASIGWRFAARFAGYQPNSTTIAAETTKDRRTDPGDTTNGEPVKWENRNDAKIPKMIPTIPPVNVNMI